MTPGEHKKRIVAITGANGFIGSRLCTRLLENDTLRVWPLVRQTGDAGLRAAVQCADVVAHVAGVTRPRTPEEFDAGNRQLTERLAEHIRDAGTAPLILFASTVRATQDTEYGRTKRAAEQALLQVAADTGAVVAIFRLPQVFGRGARPYYNAISATLLADAAQGRCTRLNAPEDVLELADVADVVRAMASTIADPPRTSGLVKVAPVHRVTVEEVRRIAAKFGGGAGPDAASPLESSLFDAFQGYRSSLTPAASPRTD